jgi:multidrug efflux pump subunit AcrB
VNDVEVHGGRDRLLEIELDPRGWRRWGCRPRWSSSGSWSWSTSRRPATSRWAALRTVAIRHRAESVDDILQLPVLTDQGRIVRLRDVARHPRHLRGRRQYYRIDGFPAVSFTIHKELGVNVVAVADAVKARLADDGGRCTRPGTGLILDEDESEAVKTQLSDLRTPGPRWPPW